MKQVGLKEYLDRGEDPEDLFLDQITIFLSSFYKWIDMDKDDWSIYLLMVLFVNDELEELIREKREKEQKEMRLEMIKKLTIINNIMEGYGFTKKPRYFKNIDELIQEIELDN